jgi:hypothetical protein
MARRASLRCLGNADVSGSGEHVKAGAKYAVLGLLLEQPGDGYEVLVRFRQMARR